MLLCIILTTTARSGGCEEQSEFRNSYRHNIYIFFFKKKHLFFHTTPLPPSYHCTRVAPRMESDRGSKDLYWPLDFANVTSVSSTRFLTVIRLQWRLKFLCQLTSQKENESDWKSFQRKTALNNKKKRNMLRLNTSKFIFNIPAKSY